LVKVNVPLPGVTAVVVLLELLFTAVVLDAAPQLVNRPAAVSNIAVAKYIIFFKADLSFSF
jgi:xanthosine utilization system XapX-like protein